MTFAPGTRVGPYELTALIGEGGMGQVYRATDTQLGRQVALKVLRPALAGDADRLARLEREARTLASLNHPGIAIVYGLETCSSEQGATVRALVMELVEGPTLADQLAPGPMRMDEALPVAKQIADALEAAHNHGVIHRDLKPANIKIRPDGIVKVLDFGLAKAIDSALTVPDRALLPTVLSPATTETGVILGTAPYMSPEQARGRPLDKRTDIWAFGCVLYEMLTGDRPFAGDSVTDTLAAIVKQEPDWTRVPARAERLIRRCLEKDPGRRLRDAGDAVLLLDEPAQPLRATSRVPWAVAAVLAAALGASLWASRSSGDAPVGPPMVPLDIDLGARPELSIVDRSMILSPVDQLLVIVSTDEDGVSWLYRRRLDSSTAEQLPGTQGAFLPFFKPDGTWIGFFTKDGLMKIPVDGGAVIKLCDAPAGRGGTWSDRDVIVAALDTRVGLSIVPSDGAPPSPLTELDPARSEAGHRLPYFLPGGRAVIFSASSDPSNWRSADIQIVTLDDRRVRTLFEGVGADGRYIESGHVVYQSRGRLLAAPFDAETLQVTGAAVPVLEGIAASEITGVSQIDISSRGYVVYQRGPVGGLMLLRWLDKAGQLLPVLDDPQGYQFPALSPGDATRLAFASDGGIWVLELENKRRNRVDTRGPRDSNFPVWVPPEGDLIVFRGRGGIFWTRADGARPPEPLLKSENFLSPLAVAPDGGRRSQNKKAVVIATSPN
jgi:serine/threonine-protein kinase